MSDRPVIIEAALNGVTRKDRNRNVPVTPEELAEDAIRCIDAGATVVHTHSHDMSAPPEQNAEAYAQAYRAVLAERPDAILYPTSGLGPTIADRYAHIVLLAEWGLIRAGFADTGSVNLGGAAADGRPPDSEYVYTNSFHDIRYKLETCARLGIGPSIACFEPGFLRVVLAYDDAGRLPVGTLVKFYLSGGGYLGAPGAAPLWGAPPTREALELYVSMIADRTIPWAVAVLGGSLLDTPVAALALERGGHLRVGLEDDQDGGPNVDAVRRAAKLCADAGRPVATASEAAGILGLPAR
ncbi:MAG: 3-keto-5-aminohexanoate cleavage protein [Actinobacteria bacterium]|nr:3-keto-5-aminohexanoate cleavage protein [Actinomycetota bacterium]